MELLQGYGIYKYGALLTGFYQDFSVNIDCKNWAVIDSVCTCTVVIGCIDIQGRYKQRITRHAVWNV
jgi:3-methyladenine DNA glycosylase AlkD